MFFGALCPRPTFPTIVSFTSGGGSHPRAKEDKENEVVQKGINEKKVYSFGIPILENFSIINDKNIESSCSLRIESLLNKIDI